MILNKQLSFFIIQIAYKFEFKSGLGFKKSDLVTTKKQLVLKRVINIFGNKRVLQQCYVLSYYTDLYLPKYK